MPHYAAVEPDGNGLMIISYKSFTFVPIAQDIEEKKDENMSEKIKGNFTLNVYRAHVYLYTYIFMSGLSSQLRVLPGEDGCLIFFIFLYIYQNNLL